MSRCGSTTWSDGAVLRILSGSEAMPSLPEFRKEMRFNFDPAKHYLWPIPQAEINSNPAITEDDQNFGY